MRKCPEEGFSGGGSGGDFEGDSWYFDQPGTGIERTIPSSLPSRTIGGTVPALALPVPNISCVSNESSLEGEGPGP